MTNCFFTRIIKTLKTSTTSNQSSVSAHLILQENQTNTFLCDSAISHGVDMCLCKRVSVSVCVCA